VRSSRPLVVGIVFALSTLFAGGARAESASLERDAGSDADASGDSTDPRRATIDRAIDLDHEGKPVEAAKRLATVLEAARTANETGPEIERAKTASSHALARIAKVRFDVPKDVFDLRVEVDGRPVLRASEGKTYSIDPGSHHVVASALRGGAYVGLDETFEVSPLEVHTVWLGQMSERPGVCPCQPIPACMNDARTEEDARRCMETGRIRPGCGGCGASSDDSVGSTWPLLPMVLGWLARVRRRAHQRSTRDA
jgi:MYXO-CTERM domain-containing protein